MISSSAIASLGVGLRAFQKKRFVYQLPSHWHVARAEIRYKARSGNDRIDLWKMETLPKPVSVAKLRAALKGRRVGIARETLKNGGHLPPQTFKSVMEALERIDRDAFLVTGGLFDRERRVRHSVPEQARMNWSLQRDAVVTALDIAKIPRGQLDVPPQPPEDTPSGVVSIFDDVMGVRGLEDILVLHDLDGAEGWNAIKSHMYPAKTFRSGDTVLTVVLANKLPLEEQLGIDLIYINETLKSVVFVQYKVMKGADGEEGTGQTVSFRLSSSAWTNWRHFFHALHLMRVPMAIAWVMTLSS